MAEPQREWRSRIIRHSEEDPEQLLANPANWRIHPKAQQDALAGVLSEVGWVQDVIVNERTGHVVDGHLRVSLAISKGERVPVVWVDLDEREEALILATIDPLAALAATDGEKLQALVSGLHADNAALEELLHGATEPAAGLTDEDEAPEPPATPVTVVGDLWRLGEHRVLCGDCREPSAIQRLFGSARANLVVTSPPYASQRKYDESSGFRPIPPDGYVEWFKDVAANISTVLADDGSYFLNIKEHCEDGQRHLYVKDLTIAHVRQWGWRFVDEFCWLRSGYPGGWENRFKNGFEPVFHYSRNGELKFRPVNVSHPGITKKYDGKDTIGVSGMSNRSGGVGTEVDGMVRPSNVLELKMPVHGGEHAAPFPVQLPEFFILACTDAGDSVFDPFMGSGSTLIAAEKNGRVGYGTELSPAYTDVIVKRWQEFTGKTATLDGDGRTFDEIAAERIGVAA